MKSELKILWVGLFFNSLAFVTSVTFSLISFSGLVVLFSLETYVLTNLVNLAFILFAYLTAGYLFSIKGVKFSNVAIIIYVLITLYLFVFYSIILSGSLPELFTKLSPIVNYVNIGVSVILGVLLVIANIGRLYTILGSYLILNQFIIYIFVMSKDFSEVPLYLAPVLNGHHLILFLIFLYEIRYKKKERGSENLLDQ